MNKTKVYKIKFIVYGVIAIVSMISTYIISEIIPNYVIDTDKILNNTTNSLVIIMGIFLVTSAIGIISSIKNLCYWRLQVIRQKKAVK